MRKILSVIGARPQFIKASVVSKQLSCHEGMKEVIVHTGQHFDSNMSDIFFSELDIPAPLYHLGINGGLHGEMTGKMMAKVEQVLINERPDIVLVYGDTNSTLAASLAGVKLGVPIAHVEAGLRSFNMAMPEEVNRIVTDRISSILFAPTEQAVNNLTSEGARAQISLVGDVMLDVALLYLQKADEDALKKLALSKKGYILVTIHRAENTDSAYRLKIIIESLVCLSKYFKVVWPIHPRALMAIKKIDDLDRIRRYLLIIDPLGYGEMIQLEKNSIVIVTDSGGVQKEAFFCGVPCVTLRDETEWTELVSSGWNRLLPPSDVEAVVGLVLDSVNLKGDAISPYGNGDAAAKIVNCINLFLG
jgi:UDP-GlcNAc3NAcA epimerase